MAEIFEKGKRYVFRKELHKSVHPTLADVCQCWTNKCDGKEVIILSDEDGLINGFMMSPRWCEEMEETECTQVN